MGGAAVNKVFLETAAPLYAELTLLLELAMAVGLVIGALLARMGRFRQHAWCQSVIVLLNLAVILLTMIPSFRVHVYRRYRRDLVRRSTVWPQHTPHSEP
jgi:ABC-type amino acid transport system permease subunit